MTKRTRREGAAEWVVLRRRLPRRAVVRLAAFAALWSVVTGMTAILFTGEPSTLDSGAANPAAGATGFVALIASLGVASAMVTVVRPPQLAVNHYGVMVRPASYRTLLLPWVHVEEVAAVTVPDRGAGDGYLLIACDDYMGRHSGDRPRFADQAVLREANRSTEGRASGFDVAVRLTDFHHDPRTILSEVARYAPDHVQVVDRLDD
ncbi:hypothetical protein [Stackebrandtia soli]|uniref:hypothetical protein n=1 Tax=Stackebrandtia soli TaxID=1892856 RepID=UPI0039E8BCF6